MRMLRTVGLALLLGAPVLASTGAAAASAANPYTPREVCGSGYAVVDSHRLGSQGRVYLLYNNGNGKNCVVTIKRKKVGTRTNASAFVRDRSGGAVNAGKFSYYAGPVYVHAPGQCVKWGGSIARRHYVSPYEHCG